MSKILDFAAANPELVALGTALIAAHVRAVVPPQYLGVVGKVVDLVVGNYRHAANKPKDEQAVVTPRPPA